MTSEAFIDRLHNQYQSQLPFIVYSLPHKIEVKAMFQYNAELYQTREYTESGFVFAPFNSANPSILIPSEQSDCIELHLELPNRYNSQKIEMTANLEDKKNHIDLVQKGIDTIKKNELKKVVVSREERIHLSEPNPIAVFQNLLNTHPNTFVYCWFHPKGGLWLGATPETLLKVEGNRLSTMALAGTQKYNGTLDVDWQDKDKEEQQIVTDYLVDKLNPFAQELNISEAKTVRAGELVHIKTDVSMRFNIEENKLDQIVNSLHPTPAVCGLPRKQSKQFIVDHETYNREFYTGFLGEINMKKTINRNTNKRNVENSAYASVKKVSNLYVNLRCMQIKDRIAHIYVGGGITKDSIPEAEWEETVNKTMTIKNCL